MLTIHEPTLSRADAATLVEQELRNLYTSCSHQPGPVRRAVLNNLTIDFWNTGSPGTRCLIRDGLSIVLEGKFNPKPSGKYSNSQLYVSRWVRGRWEESFGVPFRSYDPHWSDEVPPILKKAIRKATSLPPGSDAARQVVELMISCVDGNSEDVIEFTINGNPDATVHAGWVINAMRGPKMAAMVPLMMWVNGAHSSDVLGAYIEAHEKMGAHRKHLREILGSSDHVTAFFAFMTGLDHLERIVELLRLAPANEASALIKKLAQNSDPIVDAVFPGGVAAFLRRFLADPKLKLRWVLSRNRNGLFS